MNAFNGHIQDMLLLFKLSPVVFLLLPVPIYSNNLLFVNFICLFYVCGVVLDFVYLMYCLVHLIRHLLKLSIVTGPCPNLLPLFLSIVPKYTANMLYAGCTFTQFPFFVPLVPLVRVLLQSTQRSPFLVC